MEDTEGDPSKVDPDTVRDEDLSVLSTGLQIPLSSDDVTKIWNFGDDYGAQSTFITDVLKLCEVWRSSSQRAIVVDFYIFGLARSKSLCHTAMQASVFHGIMSRILDRARCSNIGKNA